MQAPKQNRSARHEPVCMPISLTLSLALSLSALRRANCARVEETRAFHFYVCLSRLGGLTMPEWKGRVPSPRLIFILKSFYGTLPRFDTELDPTRFGAATTSRDELVGRRVGSHLQAAPPCYSTSFEETVKSYGTNGTAEVISSVLRYITVTHKMRNECGAKE
ncbi:hypothetical protein EVAR_68424_1 [Eumeta japonica]|uniref:Secreted protein n=1 Tax=Eumeta variegata TaxID=151549 RepID=A0A4C1ZUF3_EUMVA|nr:hypothetical protein EVAR_68424_1 [Eumeta japonica]